jgi:hypothetical protein
MANTRSLQWQPSLLGGTGAAGFDASFSSAQRIALDGDAWVEHARGWVRGADALFAEIVGRAPWTQRRVHMYDRMVDEPRLIAWYGTPLDDPTLPSVLAPMARALSERYGREFDGVGAALYRTGRDSVAWPGVGAAGGERGATAQRPVPPLTLNRPCRSRSCRRIRMVRPTDAT